MALDDRTAMNDDGIDNIDTTALTDDERKTMQENMDKENTDESLLTNQ